MKVKENRVNFMLDIKNYLDSLSVEEQQAEAMFLLIGEKNEKGEIEAEAQVGGNAVLLCGSIADSMDESGEFAAMILSSVAMYIASLDKKSRRLAINILNKQIKRTARQFSGY